MECFSLFCCFYLLISFLCALFCNAADGIITQNQPLRDGQTIVSLSESFEFGFFTPEGSKNRYVGIWYYKLKPQTIVWVANREHPLTEYSKGGVVTIGQDGNMLVLDGNGTSIWSTKASVLATDSIAMLQDSGNLILKEPNSNIFIWQSFDHPTDTFLPGMKLMMSSKQNRFLSSWRSPINPEVGIFKFGYESNKLSLWHGSITYWTSGDWNGSIFEMVPPEDALSPLFNLTKVIEGNEVYFTYSSPLNKTRLVMNVNGALEFYILDLDSWYIDWWLPKAPCDYVSCGSFGRCYYTDINLFDRFGNQRDYALCNCLRGFEPTSQKNWEAGDWSGGCKRRMPLGCDNNEEDGFISYNLMLMENTTISSYQVETAENCRLDCLHNCNCSAYAYANEKYVGATTCKIWDGDLSHVRLLDYHVQEVQELFIRMSAFEIGTIGYWWRKKSLKRKDAQRAKVILGVDKFRKNGRKDLDVPFFDFQSIAAATNNFSDSNKLGQGGFGPVYKGSLPGGQEIAVKRLSRCSGQGLEEFKTEVILIAKLQHRNLVRLLGFCVQGDEQMLLYEYMPNKSLDYFLFDQNRHSLDWEKRLSIISGIARGLLYLHQDSRLRIIHRDLKPSNILLDEMWNPKISDFGMARIFGENQTQANTNRVIGTYGYMPPEYALEGTYSEKSDVFSFGVMLLEIVSGKKNTTFYHSEHSFSLLGNAWRLWREGRGLELMDPLLNEGSNIQDVLKCIHVGLLCVQQDAADRPTMVSVVAMFVGESNNLATPNKPAFFTTRSLSAVESSSHGPEICSQNEITISTLQGR